MKAFEDGVTYEATKILEDNVAGGTGTHAQIGCPQGGKTGTTDHNIDAWFVGFTPRMATAVWVGFPGNAQVSMNGMYRPTGGNIDGGTYPGRHLGRVHEEGRGQVLRRLRASPSSRSSASRSSATTRRRASRRTRRARAPPATTARTRPTRRTRPARTARRPTPTPTSPGTGTDQKKPAGNNGATYDPSQYETQPQGQPQTGTAGGGTKAPGDG